MKILITGGAGYIGSTIASLLSDNGHVPVILDSLALGREEFVRDRIFYKGDIADRGLVEKIFHEHPDIFGVIHCAALIVIPESVANPYQYYRENVGKSLEFFMAVSDLGLKRIIFSSSASIYAPSENFLVTEESAIRPLSPYARTKQVMEMVLEDFCSAYDLKGIALRYFNPIGADPKMRSGLYVKNPSHILGRLVEVAARREEFFSITGTDYPTRDGSGIRDYIHVWDIARAHLLALERFDEAFGKTGGEYLAANLGTGNGVTVKELVAAFEKVLGREIPKKETPRRPGDTAGAYASRDKAESLFGWRPELSLEEAIRDALRWNEERQKQLGY